MVETLTNIAANYNNLGPATNKRTLKTVAVVRDQRVIASPRPDFGFRAGDVVVAVGTADGTAAVVDLLTRG